MLAAVGMASAGFVQAVPPKPSEAVMAPFEWAVTRDVPDTLPVFVRTRAWSAPAAPSHLNNIPDIGYVVILTHVDERGESHSPELFATLPDLALAVRNTFPWFCKPARRAGRRVDAWISCTMAFNPASADATLPDATPRLLKAALVADPALESRPRGEAPPGPLPDPHLPTIVWAKVALDAAGIPIAVTDAPGHLVKPIETSLRDWKFAPARRGGLPVAAELEVPFILGRSMKIDVVDEANTPPRLMKLVNSGIASLSVANGLKGNVLLSITVDAAGKVAKAHVIRSLNPAYNQPVLDNVYKWKYQPAVRGGVPVAETISFMISTGFYDTARGGRSGAMIEGRDEQDQLPPEFRYDVPAQMIGSVVPVYPYALQRAGVRGAALVGFVIGADGRVVHSEVFSAATPEFGLAFQAAIEGFQFEPALRNGRPTKSMLTAEQHFPLPEGIEAEMLGFMTADREKERELLQWEQGRPERIVLPEQLDVPLRCISDRPPIFPVMLRNRVHSGVAVVETLVDEKGLARLPRIISASAPEFGYAAVQAVSTWRFDPPQRGGKKAVVRLRVPIEFGPGAVVPTTQ